MWKSFTSRYASELVRLTVADQLMPNAGNAAALAELAMGAGDVLQAAKFMNRQANLLSYSKTDLLAFHRRFPASFLNIGGGPGFFYPLWANLDAVESPFNPTPFHLTAHAALPFRTGAFDLVYSSHALEHLDTPTVENVLRESHRMLKPEGALLIKIPDYSALLDAWKDGSPALVADGLWNFSSVVPTLKNRGLSDSLTVRTAYIICGFWNREFGHVFEKYDPFAEGAYNGPAALSEGALVEILNMKSPQKIAASMRQHIVETEKSFFFNHQNAWSREEFEEGLIAAGFELASYDKAKIVGRFAHVPRILDMYDISAYFLAFPVDE